MSATVRRRDAARREVGLGLFAEQEEVDLPRPPVEPVTHGQDVSLGVGIGARRRDQRPPRAVQQRRVRIGVVPRQPLVGDAPADAELPRRGGDLDVEMADGMDEGKADFVHG
jgi:hypothetical protein